MPGKDRHAEYLRHKERLAKDCTCETCGKAFGRLTRDQRFCSRKCAKGNKAPRTCIRCNAQIDLKKRPTQQFCSLACWRADMQDLPRVPCVQCGRDFQVVYQGQRFCSRRCVRNSRIIDGPTTTAQGYLRVRVPLGTPHADRTHRMLQHRWVMTQALGRPLEDHETIHHINGVKTDNRLENLQLRNGRHGKGTMLVCLDCGSRNIGHTALPSPLN